MQQRPALRRRRRRGRARSCASASSSRVAAGIARERILRRPRDRLRQDRRAQPRAARAPRRARRAGPADAGRDLAQVVPRRRSTGRREHDRLAATIATNVIALLRGASVFRVHDVAAVARRARGRGCYGQAAMSEEPRRGDGTSPTTTSISARACRPVVTIEISGLSLYTHIGVSAAEREVGQRLLFDIRIDVGESDATETDRIEDTVDYGEVCQLVALVAQQRSYRTLERLCTVVADRMIERVRRRGGLGQGGQARAADPADGRGGLGRGLARAARVTRRRPPGSLSSCVDRSGGRPRIDRWS